MSTFSAVGVPLLTVADTLAGGWFVTTRITDHWDQIKKHREMDLAAAEHFQRLYGEFIVVWKTWNALEGKHAAACPAPEEARWDCLQRMIEVEGEVEALVAKLATGLRLADTPIPEQPARRRRLLLSPRR